MDNKQLTGIYRTEDFGSAGSRRLLRSGRIPAVIYGKNDPVHISLDSKEFTNRLKHFNESTLLTISLGMKKHSVLMKNFQENVMYSRIQHVDFFEVTSGETLRARVTLILHGNPAGARLGGVLEQVAHDIEIECLPKDLPESIVIDISKLGLNESIHVSEVPAPAGVKILTTKDTVVASVKSIKEVVAAPELEEAEEVAEESK